MPSPRTSAAGNHFWFPPGSVSGAGLSLALVEVELALEVRAHRVEPAEAHLHAHLAELGHHDHETAHALGQRDA
jgi:hypothetical protein